MKTNKKDFKQFKKYFKKYAFDIMGLKNYEAYFEHVEMDGCFAHIDTDIGGQISRVRFNKEHKRIKNDIKISAFHESCELLLARLNMLAQSRFITPTEIEEANHEVIRVLEHEWFPLIKERNK